MPVGTWVNLTAEATFCTFWPPGPLDRKKSIFRSSDRSSTSESSSSAAGSTSTRANDVCRLRAGSKGEIRTRRCTPTSALR